MGLNNLLVIVSLLLIFFGCRQMRSFYIYRKWINYDAIIIEINEKHRNVALSQYQRIKYFFPEIQYKYEYKNKHYISSNVGFGIESVWVPEVDVWGNKLDKSNCFWFSWKSGQNINIYINPSNPEESVIIRKNSNERINHCVTLCVSGFLLFCVWLVIS